MNVQDIAAKLQAQAAANGTLTLHVYTRQVHRDSTRDLFLLFELRSAHLLSAAPVASKPPTIVRSQEPEEELPPHQEEPQHQHEEPAATEEAPVAEEPAATEEAPAGGEEAAPASEAGSTLPLHDANGNVVGSVSADGSTIHDAAGNLLCTMQVRYDLVVVSPQSARIITALSSCAGQRPPRQRWRPTRCGTACTVVVCRM